MSFAVVAAVALAGALGAVSRFLLTELLRACGGAFPLSTLVVNLCGCLLFGLFWGLGHDRWQPVLQDAMLVGFLGSFTTFSTFAFDNMQLCVAGRWFALCGNLVLQNGIGLVAVFCGVRLAAMVGTSS